MHTRTSLLRNPWYAAIAVAGALIAGGCGKKQPDAGAGSGSAAAGPPSVDRNAAIEKWVNEFQPSTLSRDQQVAELKWFQEAAKPFAGMEIKVVSETIDTHVYESKTLAPAFHQLTGIKVTHDIIQEGDLIE